MNENELRAYALRGLTTRLSELDRERASIVALLAKLAGAGEEVPAARERSLSPEARQRIGEAARRRWAQQRAVTAASTTAEPVTPDEQEVARVLPRRGRSHQAAKPDSASLPPMPRLIKARAS